MKITKKKLEKIINEEVQAVLSEMPVPALGVLAGSNTVEGFSEKIFLESLYQLARDLEGIAIKQKLDLEAKIAVELEHGDIILAGAPGRGRDPETKAEVQKMARRNIKALERALKRGYNHRLHAKFSQISDLASYRKDKIGKNTEKYPVKIEISYIEYGQKLISRPMSFKNEVGANAIHPAKLAAVIRAFAEEYSKGKSFAAAASGDRFSSDIERIRRQRALKGLSKP